MSFSRIGRALVLALLAVAALATPSEAGRPRPRPFTSDDFDTACGTLSSLWTFENPVGDGSYQITGVGTQDAQLRISVPAGVSHDLWTGQDHAPRVVQGIDNNDFTAEVKFESPLTQQSQGQGFLATNNFGTTLRFDFFSDGTNLNVFAGVISGGVGTVKLNAPIAPASTLWLRVQRVGPQWTMSTSANGTSYTTAVSFQQDIVVRKVGVFAINDAPNPANSPAHTAVVDYVFNAASPIAPEDGAIAGDPGPKTLATLVNGSGSVTRLPDLPSYVCGQTVQVSATPAAGSAFVGWSGDASGQTNPIVVVMSTNKSVTANFMTDTTPPVISSIHASPGSAGATIAWTTDEIATSQVEYGTTLAYEGGSISVPALVTAHSVDLANLTASTHYHYRVTSVNQAGLSSTSADQTFDTLAQGGGGPSGFVSDDFQRNNLDRGLWEVVDPQGDAAVRIRNVGTTGGEASIEIPGGAQHWVGPSGISAPRIRQHVNDTDFTIAVGFTSPITQAYQEQGIVIEESASRYLRFDFYSDGSSNLRLYSAAFLNGATQTKLNATLAPMLPMYMRVARAGDQWTLSTSPDGNIWTERVSFNQPLDAATVGVFAGNEGAPAPAQTAQFDYVFNASTPIVPEDGAVPPDGEIPWIQRVKSIASQTTAQLKWVTDEPSSSRVEYGTTTAYELGAVENASPVFDHLLALENLTPGTVYHYRVLSTDGSTNTATDVDRTFTTLTPGATQGPVIDVWYGPVQHFGQIGLPQPIVNILGNVSDPDGVASMSYSLNGGPAQPLSLGSNFKRLADPGDFNADIQTTDLLEGVNSVELTASDTLGNVTTQLVTVHFEGNNVWPLPYSIDWSTVTALDQVSQVVDGHWTVEGDTLRPVQFYYDRLVAVGDVTWTDYEALVPITMHQFFQTGFEMPFSNRPALGGCLRWVGHASNGVQPADGLVPIGACLIYRINQTNGSPPNTLESWTTHSTTSPATIFQIDPEVTYWWKMRVETTVAGPLYSLKVWPDGQPEPPAWTLQEQLDNTELTHGSMLLLAHHVDASFGPLVVTPLP